MLSLKKNTLTSADANKLEPIQRKVLALCHNRLFPQMNDGNLNSLGLRNQNFHTFVQGSST
jgi:hypothetical protein